MGAAVTQQEEHQRAYLRDPHGHWGRAYLLFMSGGSRARELTAKGAAGTQSKQKISCKIIREGRSVVAGEVRELRGGVLQATSSMKSSSSLREFAVWERVKATRRPHLLHWGNRSSSVITALWGRRC